MILSDSIHDDDKIKLSDIDFFVLLRMCTAYDIKLAQKILHRLETDVKDVGLTGCNTTGPPRAAPW